MLNQNPDEFVLKQIKNLCNERNWSLYRLSMESSIPYSTLNNLFRRGNVPSISTLCKICDAFRISLSEFFSGNRKNLRLIGSQRCRKKHHTEYDHRVSGTHGGHRHH